MTRKITLLFLFIVTMLLLGWAYYVSFIQNAKGYQSEGVGLVGGILFIFPLIFGCMFIFGGLGCFRKDEKLYYGTDYCNSPIEVTFIKHTDLIKSLIKFDDGKLKVVFTSELTTLN